MATTLLKMLTLASVLVSAETTWSESLVLADCGIGLGPDGGSTSREMMYYSAEAWGAPTYMKNVPWDGSYPWRGSGVSQTLPNGDTWTVLINNGAGDPNLAGWATHTYDNVALSCWSRHLDGLFTLADGKKCSMAYICNHQSFPNPPPNPPPIPPPAPPSGPLGENATPGALKYQPVIDFDKSACYNTAAITRDGHCNDGLEIGQGDCRQLDRLYNSNTYVREKCTNDGWCFYLYGYYFEKDEGGALAHGHKHDWEHLAVWTLNNEAKYLGWSAHGNYKVNKPNSVEWQGNNPKFVVERDMATTHAFRRAEGNEPPENASGKWYCSPLVSLERMDGALKEKMLTHDWGNAHPDLTDERFDKAYWSTWADAKALDQAGPPRPDPVPPPHLEL
ncbi:uncharacterized protein TRIVIDRAFT_46830 [Trichoderma virens Gv29-8]|uniref:Secreted protein n=1 Tax=Hypocrea virens (strain Gv29-8 / FGSC 10586) TaxID=413071 RepID=G9N0D3_HYPVG|nr:uncharacterized protein TRIVIDRAFT_46830 [Trichoderma virens Gv29-8]EHK19815.1 hypothetical protein TRIVIDRAFT_46830 [Trichoderma virens Gv29-8]UKZ53203.1 hypothetical protein TrVGV298_006995 [Trichoderma virens]